MGKAAVIVIGLFVAAMVLPELRVLLFVGGFCLVTGYMVGMQHRARHNAELSYDRLLRNVRQLET